jgi:putative DNA primase/helicase
MLSPDNDCFKAVLKYNRDHGWALFAAPAGAKKSHKSARGSNGLPWGKTRDPDQLRKDWQEWPDADIGLPCGADNKVWAVEADTLQGHGVDGVGNLRKLIEQHGGIPETLMSLTPSGSIAYYFSWPNDVVIKNSTSMIAPGVDVRGEVG